MILSGAARRLRGRRPLVRLRRSGARARRPAARHPLGHQRRGDQRLLPRRALGGSGAGAPAAGAPLGGARAEDGARLRPEAGDRHPAPPDGRRGDGGGALRRDPDVRPGAARDLLARRHPRAPAAPAPRAQASPPPRWRTGRTVVFMQTSPDLVIPASAPPRTLFRADHQARTTRSPAQPSRSSSRPCRSGRSSTWTAACARTRRSRRPSASAPPTSSPSAARREVKGCGPTRGSPRPPGLPARRSSSEEDPERLPARSRGRRHRAPHCASNCVLADGTPSARRSPRRSRARRTRGAPAYRYVHNSRCA